MDPIDLDHFNQVARAGGIREAARLLNIAPSAISRRITRLEQHLGTKLLERHASGTSLTATGRRLLTYIHEVHSARQRLQRDLDAATALQQGHIYISCTEGQLELLGSAMTQFQQHYPKITFEVHIGSARNVLRTVEQGQADLGIAFAPILHPPLESAVEIPAPLQAIVQPEHPLAQKQPPLPLNELAPWPLALPPDNFAIRRLFDQAAQRAHLQPRIALCTDSISAIKSFAQNPGNVAILSTMSVKKEVEDGRLVGVPLSDPLLHGTQINVCALGRRRLPPAVHTFLRFLRQVSSQPEAPA